MKPPCRTGNAAFREQGIERAEQVQINSIHGTFPKSRPWPHVAHDATIVCILCVWSQYCVAVNMKTSIQCSHKQVQELPVKRTVLAPLAIVMMLLFEHAHRQEACRV